MSPLATIGLAMLAALLAGLSLLFRRREVAAARRVARLRRVCGKDLDTRWSLKGPETTTPRRDALMLQCWPRADGLRDRLAQTGSTMTLGRFGTVALGLAGGGFVVATVVAGPIAGAIAATVALLLPGRWLGRRAAKRRRRFMDQFPEAIDLVVRALGAGLPLAAALGSVGDEFVDPAGAEFRHVRAGLAIGQSVEEALWELVARIDCAELRFFTISVAVQQQTGGNLAETLTKLAEMLRGRAQMRLKIKAMTGEARASATVLGLLPFAIGVLMALVNPAYLLPLILDQRGWIMIGGGATMLAMGVGSMAMLIKFDV